MSDDQRTKLAPGKLNYLQTAPYPAGDKPLDIRIIWFLLQVRRAFMLIVAAIEKIIEAENSRL